MTRPFLALLLCFPVLLKEPTETQKEGSVRTLLSLGMTLPGTWNPGMESSFSGWVPGRGWGAGWAGLPAGPPLELHTARERRWASRKMGEQGHTENVDFSAVWIPWRKNFLAGSEWCQFQLPDLVFWPRKIRALFKSFSRS